MTNPLWEIIKEYIYENKKMFITVLILSCLNFICKILITSKMYSKIVDRSLDFKYVMVQIAFVWMAIVSIDLINSIIQNKISPDFYMYLRKKCIEYYFKNNEYNFDDTKSSQDLNIIINMCVRTRQIFLVFLSTFIPIITVGIMINLYFLVKHPLVGALMVVGNIINYYITYHELSKHIDAISKAEQHTIEQTGRLNDNFNNMMNIFLNDKVDDTIEDVKRRETEFAKMYSTYEMAMHNFVRYLKINNYVFAFLSIVLLYKLTNNKVDKDNKDFVNSLFIFTFYLEMIQGAMGNLPSNIIFLGVIQKNVKVIGNKIRNPSYIKHLHDAEPLQQTIPLSSFTGHITFNHLNFRYKPDTPLILDDFTLDIPAGDRVMILARSGSGKTTLMKVLLGFYKLDSGEILLDGQDIRKYSLKDVRKKIHYVNQRTLLFHDTIINNMKYGNSKSDEEILEFLKKYDLLKIFCNDLSNCLNKMVESNGVNMSLGMQKVIYLVRGILKEGVDVFIFDEPLSSIDPSTRSLIIDMIAGEIKNKTLIIITHDLEISRIVNRKIELKDKENT